MILLSEANYQGASIPIRGVYLHGVEDLTHPPLQVVPALHVDSRLQRVAKRDNSGWSVYGAHRSQQVATGGKWGDTEHGSGKRNPLPWVATGCRADHMVRRGSTVRVRQRALQKSRKAGLLVSGAVAKPSECGGYGALYGALRSRSASRTTRIRACVLSIARTCCCSVDRAVAEPSGSRCSSRINRSTSSTK